MLNPLKPKTCPLLTPRQNTPPGVTWDQFVQPVSISRFTCIICAKCIPNRSSRLTTFPRLLNCWPLTPPPMPPWGELFLAYVHSQMNPQTRSRISCQSVLPFDRFPRLKFVTPNPPPRNAPCGIVRWIVFSYVHSQTNRQTCAKFGVNRSSSLIASQYIWICDPLKPPKMPPGALWGELYLAYVQSQMKPQTWTKVGANRSSRLSASPDFWMIDPLKTPKCPTCVSNGNLFWVYHSQMNLHMCPKFGANRSGRLAASTDVLICDHLKPPKCPWNIEGRILFSLCPFPDESADVYTIWCQSVQLFDSFPRLLNLWPL